MASCKRKAARGNGLHKSIEGNAEEAATNRSHNVTSIPKDSSDKVIILSSPVKWVCPVFGQLPPAGRKSWNLIGVPSEREQEVEIKPRLNFNRISVELVSSLDKSRISGYSWNNCGAIYPHLESGLLLCPMFTGILWDPYGSLWYTCQFLNDIVTEFPESHGAIYYTYSHRKFPRNDHWQMDCNATLRGGQWPKWHALCCMYTLHTLIDTLRNAKVNV